MSLTVPPTIAFIGFGEAAQAFCGGWSTSLKKQVRAYDIKTEIKGTRAQKQADYETAAIAGCDTIAECLTAGEVVISMVTADQALAAGRAAAAEIAPHALYFDCNSCAPETKRAVAKIIEAAGAHYVDVAVMAPVHPKLNKTPVLISGPHTKAALAMMTRLEMSGDPIEGDIGAASSIKMVRSIMVKGLEALMAECVLAGRRAGVEDIVLETLEKSYPGFGWADRAAYGMDRMMQHGTRRAAEMREVALTVSQLGLDNAMSNATVQWQHSIGELALVPLNSTYTAGADAILNALPPPSKITRR